MDKKRNTNNKIAFLDFEFGQIYGSHRRDFLITEAAILIYNHQANTLELGEVILKPDVNVVLRKKYKTEKGKVRKLEKVFNLHTGQIFNYDKNFKLPHEERVLSRKLWNKKFYKKLILFLNSSLNNIDEIYVYGGNEDVNLLNKYNIKYQNIVDLQSVLRKKEINFYPDTTQNQIGKAQHSLDFFISNFNLEHTIEENQLKFADFNYQLPQHLKSYNYDLNNFTSHCASGDCIRVFSLYKTLTK